MFEEYEERTRMRAESVLRGRRPSFHRRRRPHSAKIHDGRRRIFKKRNIFWQFTVYLVTADVYLKLRYVYYYILVNVIGIT